jgi:hypothetical protein
MKADKQAIATLAKYAVDKIDSRSHAERIEIYNALSLILPKKNDRLAARKLAFSFEETAKLQMEFTKIIK